MLWLPLFLFSFSAFADSEEADRLKVRVLSDLNFGQAVQGDPARTVPPGTTENGSNASFQVNGRPFHNYTILLPNRHVQLTRSNGEAGIALTRFSSFPDNANGVLDSHGQQIFFVGATRGAIPAASPRGEYSGRFEVVILY